MTMGAYATAGDAPNADLEFSQDFLVAPASGEQINIKRFAKKNVAMAGVYAADLSVNDRWMGKTDIVLKDLHGPDDGAVVCISTALFEMFEVDVTRLSPQATQRLAALTAQDCLQLEEIVPDASLLFDAGALRLAVHIPQFFVLKNARGDIHPRLWDRGVNAATLSYHFNSYRSVGASVVTQSSYLSLNQGVNWGDWHFRHTGSLTKNNHHAIRYQPLSTYVQRDLVGIRSQLTLGDATTVGPIFESMGFRGLHLSSDARMLPDSQSGYAPVIRGIAHSHANVRVMQHGMLLHSMSVAPGPFEINDLYATGYGGNLDVLIHEANGERRTFTVPYVAFTPLLRRGALRYSVTAGDAQSSIDQHPAHFLQAVAGIGVNNYLTVYGGILSAPHYVSVAMSAAMSTLIGAFSADVIHAQAKHHDGVSHQGKMYSLKYNHQFQASNTGVFISAMQVNHRHYEGLSEFLMHTDVAAPMGGAVGHVRQRLQWSIQQSLARNAGNFFLSGASHAYWDRGGRDVHYAVGYSQSLGRMSVSVSAQRQQSAQAKRAEHQLFLNVSMPLGQDHHSGNMLFSHSHQSSSHATMATLHGVLDQQGNVTYSMTGAHQGGPYGAASMQYRGAYALANGSVSADAGMHQMSASMTGAVVVHPGGITLAQTLGESIGIITAKDAAGARVNNTRITINRFGHAVMPSLRPYRWNQIDLDPKGLPLELDLMSTKQRVTPHAGAVVMLDFTTRRQRVLLMDMILSNGAPPPFGAEVMNDEGEVIGMTGQGGRLFVRGLNADAGTLWVKWGKDAHSQCRVSYHLPTTARSGHTLMPIAEVCRTEHEIARMSDHTAH
jgi:outer membrane usher protein